VSARGQSRTDPVAGLLASLRGAAAEDFAGVLDEGLGQRLRAAADAIVAAGPLEPRWEDQLRRFRSGLDRFEERGRQDRAVVVAHGLRICRGLRPPSPSPRSPAAPAATRPASGSRASLAVLPGVGPKTAARLAERGLTDIEGLLWLLPRGYQDRRTRDTLDAVGEDRPVVVQAAVRSFRAGFFRGRFMATARLTHDTPAGPIELEARWFHRVGGLAERLATGAQVVLAGTAKHWRGKWSLVHPEVFPADVGGPPIAVRYPVVEGVGQRALQRLCKAALDHLAAAGEDDPLPAFVREQAGLLGREEAFRRLHDPPEDLDAAALAELAAGTSAAHRRLAFEELFFIQLALLRRRAQLRARPCAVGAVDRAAAGPEVVRACVPFEPTAAQWRAIEEIGGDLAGSEPMLRLLQGDVGSGKTLVAFVAALAVVRAGAQVAVMAPTEILADQHLRTMGPWCDRAGIRIAMLTAGTPRAQRNSVLSLLGAGRIDVLVGTHALLVEDVAFARLGLAIVDEQHRFGVEQRTLLREKGRAPHLLVMTATPIPRTLALTAFGELDVSVIDELPPGRTPPDTELFHGRRGLETARRRLAARVAEGARVFVVCPLVEASESMSVSDVEATATGLRALMPAARIGVVHGRLPAAERDAIMRAFRDGELDVLVATTVIEVGVDVPQARAILVEHAERFGLAQLHQLRGRVGRSDGASMCLIHTAHGRGSEVGERLAVLARTADGFRVAERDLELRGPGELFGTRQSGVPRLRVAGFAGEGLRLLVAARTAAQAVLERDPELSRTGLGTELAARVERPVYSAESG
jgi:ATP-dependent DNA helicase RecG